MAKTKLSANDEDFIVMALKRLRDDFRDCGIEGQIVVSAFEDGEISALLTVEKGTVMSVSLSNDDNTKTVSYAYGEVPCSKQ